MDFLKVEITESKIDLENAFLFIDHPGHGAQLLFSGVVRNENLGKKVLGVSYDIFPALALAKIKEICVEANQQWGPSLRVCVIHRVGRLEVGESSVVIGVSSPHRDEAYLASRYVIDELKHRAPIWKKEHYEDGETEWLVGHALCT